MNSPYLELIGFLSALPNMGTAAERKALLAFSGYALLGLYVDYSGSQADFAKALVAVIGRRGQQLTLQFLAGLKDAPQVGAVHQEQLADLQNRLVGLSLATWETVFPVNAGEIVATTTILPDPDMLTLSIVSDVLLPFYTLGAQQWQDQSGVYAADLARQVVDVLESDVRIRPLLNMFKAAPTATEAGFVAALKGILAEDVSLACALAQILDAQDGEGTADLSALVQISQDIRVVSGDVVGAIVGQDVVGKLTVKQKIDSVSFGGTVVGAVIGAPAEVRIGGQTVAGDYVAGDKVAGDQIKMGDIIDSDGIAIGRGASVNTE